MQISSLPDRFLLLRQLFLIWAYGRAKMPKICTAYPSNLAVYRQFGQVGERSIITETLNGTTFHAIISSFLFSEPVNDK